MLKFPHLNLPCVNLSPLPLDLSSPKTTEHDPCHKFSMQKHFYQFSPQSSRPQEIFLITSTLLYVMFSKPLTILLLSFGVSLCFCCFPAKASVLGRKEESIPATYTKYSLLNTSQNGISFFLQYYIVDACSACDPL